MPTLRVWFTLICMVEYIVVALLAELTAWLIKKWLGITVAAPLFVWAVQRHFRLRHHKFHTEAIL